MVITCDHLCGGHFSLSLSLSLRVFQRLENFHTTINRTTESVMPYLTMILNQILNSLGNRQSIEITRKIKIKKNFAMTLTLDAFNIADESLKQHGPWNAHQLKCVVVWAAAQWHTSLFTFLLWISFPFICRFTHHRANPIRIYNRNLHRQHTHVFF